MGLLGDLVGGVLNAALDSIKQGLDESSNGSNLNNSKNVAVLFSYTSMISGPVPAEVWNHLIEQLLLTSGEYLDIEVNDDNQFKNWDIKIETYAYERLIESFVVTNSSTVIKFGWYNTRTSCAFAIEGQNCVDIANKILAFLDTSEFDYLQIINTGLCLQKVPFKDLDWMETVESKLISNIDSESEEEDESSETKLFIDGSISDCEQILDKFDDLFLTDIEDLFDEDSLVCDVVSPDEEKQTELYVLKDGETAVAFNCEDSYLDDEEGYIILHYYHNNQALLLSFSPQEDQALFFMSYSEEENEKLCFSGGYEQSNYAFWELIDELEENGCSIPEDFCDHLNEFLKEICDKLLELSDD